MTCNHEKINDSDWFNAANVDAADAGVEFFSTPVLRQASMLANAHKCVHNLCNTTLVRASYCEPTLTLDKKAGSRHQTHFCR